MDVDEGMIRCVTIFYKEGKSAKDYVLKENFRVTLPQREMRMKDLEILSGKIFVVQTHFNSPQFPCFRAWSLLFHFLSGSCFGPV